MHFLTQSNKDTVGIIGVTSEDGNNEFILTKVWASDKNNILEEIMGEGRFNPYFTNANESANIFYPTSKVTINIFNKSPGIYFDVTFSIGNSIWNFTAETKTNKNFNDLKKHIVDGNELTIQLQSPSHFVVIRGIKNSNILHNTEFKHYISIQ